jgi:SAM-dependent methyltransferase
MPIDASAVSRAQELYRVGTGVRPAALGEADARAYLRDYVEFVRAVARPAARVLDVACGSGWSSRLLRESSFDVCGVDLTVDALEVSSGPGLEFAEGDATSLPFASSSFDVVCAYQTLEHVPDPARALGEFDRVLKPGGVVCVVGPNLLGLGASVKALLSYVWRNRPLRTIVLRTPGMPRHPHGNTLPEVAASLGGNIGRLIKKAVQPAASFSMRTPDTTPPFHADNDACYLCNPIDLTKYFRERRYRVVHFVKPGRPFWTAPLAGGTWFAASKPVA